MGEGGAQRPAARVRAVTVRVRDRFVLARFGRLSRDRFRDQASDELRATIEAAGDHWVPFEQFVEATELACNLFGEGDLGLAREIGAYGAENAMGVWQRLVYRVLSPATVLSIAAGIWSHHYDGGRLVAKAEGKKGVRIRIEDFPTPHRTHCLSIEGWFERTIQLGRPKKVTVSETLCRCRGNDACELVAEWE
jgi:predicted hydrocarbon binding protein